MAINTISTGLSMIAWACRPKRITIVANRPAIEMGAILLRNEFKRSSPAFNKILRVIYPATRGITTYNTTDNNKVSHGTVMLVTPNKKPAIGANATINLEV